MLNSHVVFEQPLNERVRTFLRVEHLLDQGGRFLRTSATEPWDSRLCLTALLDVIDLMSRSDLKSEIIKELERHAGTLAALQRNPGVDQERLETILGDIARYIAELRDPACQPGQALRSDELVQSVRQRNAIPGGTCNFDLPGFHHWLHRPAEVRRASLEHWHADLAPIRRGLKLALNMIRSSSTPTREVAERGFFQRPIEPGTACQLIRVVLPADSRYYPEISAGRHRFTVRFMEQPDTRQRPVQTEDAVEFELHCCVL